MDYCRCDNGTYNATLAWELPVIGSFLSIECRLYELVKIHPTLYIEMPTNERKWSLAKVWMPNMFVYVMMCVWLCIFE